MKDFPCHSGEFGFDFIGDRDEMRRWLLRVAFLFRSQ